jgi:hypothetical protein
MRSMVEGAGAVRKTLRHQEKRQCKRPSHRARARSPLPAVAGRDKAMVKQVLTSPNLCYRGANSAGGPAVDRCTG